MSEEAVAVREDFQDAAGELMALAIRPRGEDLVEEGVLGFWRPSFALRLHLVEEREELLRGFGLQFREVHRAPSPVLIDARTRTRAPCAIGGMQNREWLYGP